MGQESRAEVATKSRQDISEAGLPEEGWERQGSSYKLKQWQNWGFKRIGG